jgi:hypothetical protein
MLKKVCYGVLVTLVFLLAMLIGTVVSAVLLRAVEL